MSDSGYPVRIVDGAVWYVCPVDCGFRVLGDDRLGVIPLDAMDVHVQAHRLEADLSHIRAVLTPPPDPRSRSSRLPWERKKGA